MNTIRDILNEVQRSTQTHKLCIKKLAAAINVRDQKEQENITYFLNGGIDRILLHATNAAGMDRSISFLGSFLSTVDENILTLTLRHICSRLQSSNKLVRQRICHITYCVLDALCEAKTELSDELFVDLSAHMVSRLKDKVPAVRIWAAKALKFLQVPEDDNDEATVQLKRVMRSDSSAAVRVAAVEVLTLTDGTKHDLCARLKDVKSDVRVAVLNRLALETDMRQFTVQMRAEILRSALEDREEVVRNAVLSLIWKWLSLVDNSNISKFLNLLNPSENEEAALLVGATIMEELIKTEASSQLGKLKRNVKECNFKWNNLASNGTGSSLTPSDVLWIQIRCSYARQFLPVLPASEICDALLPDAVDLCTVLKDVKATLFVPSQHHSKQSSIVKAQFVVKYLLNLAPLLIGSTDVSGLSQLMTECADAFLNTNVALPWECVESALRAHSELHTASGSASHAHRAVLEMAANLREQAARLAEPSEEDTEATAPTEVSQKLLLSITERCLQLTHWALQQELSIMATKGSKESDSDEEEPSVDAVFTDALPHVLQSLQQPQYHIRYLAVGCLGLICMVDPKLCDAYRGLILQVASGDFEETSIRSQALQSLVDFSVVFRGKYVDDADLGNVLLRMQESGEPESMLVAAEAAAKLLHSGTHHEPRLFANLLKFFFLTESLPDATAPLPSGKSSGIEEEDLQAAQDEYEHRMFLANCARLQQILSIFFHVFTTTDVIADQVVAESIPYLVADMTSEIKDGTVDATALPKILRHLFSLCENKAALPETGTTPSELAPEVPLDEDGNPVDVPPAEEATKSSGADGALALVRATTAAALSKELLKLGNSKLEKSIDKEYVKIMSTLAFESWIHNYDVASIERVVDTITLCSGHDKTTSRYLDQLMLVCASAKSSAAPGARSQVEFVNLAAGLTDLIEIAARSSVLDMSMDEGASFCADDASQSGLDSLPGSAVKPKRSTAPRRPPSAAKAAAPSTRRTSARTSSASTTTVRTSARRPSYVEHDSESDEEPVSDVEEEPSESEEDSAEDFGGVEDNVEEGRQDLRQGTMSPTKQFILTTAGTTRGRATRTTKAAAGKKIAMQLDAELGAVDKGSKRKGAKAASGDSKLSSDENKTPNADNYF